MRGKFLREKFARGDYVYGTHTIGLVSPPIPEWMKKSGMDFAFICNEHIPLDRSEISNMCHLYAAHGISPMVRIPYPDARLATIAVEGGAEGIVIPYVETVEEVRQVSAALRYRPIKGAYLQAFLAGEKQFSDKLTAYMEQHNENLYLVIGVESIPAIENLDALLSVDGVSAVFLGPHDISCSMGIPLEYDNPEFIDTLVNVIRRCREKGVAVGAHIDPTWPHYQPCLEAGMNFILAASDITIAIPALSEKFEYVRENYEKKQD